MTLENVIVQRGHATGYFGSGGAFRSHNGVIVLRNSIVSGNNAGNGGNNNGGAFSLKSAYLTLIDSQIIENTATGQGGGIYDYGASLEEFTVTVEHLVHMSSTHQPCAYDLAELSRDCIRSYANRGQFAFSNVSTEHAKVDRHGRGIHT